MSTLLRRIEKLEAASGGNCTCHDPRKIVEIIQRDGVSDKEVEQQIAALPVEVREPPICPVHRRQPVSVIVVRGFKDQTRSAA